MGIQLTYEHYRVNVGLQSGGDLPCLSSARAASFSGERESGAGIWLLAPASGEWITQFHPLGADQCVGGFQEKPDLALVKQAALKDIKRLPMFWCRCFESSVFRLVSTSFERTSGKSSLS